MWARYSSYEQNEIAGSQVPQSWEGPVHVIKSVTNSKSPITDVKELFCHEKRAQTRSDDDGKIVRPTWRVSKKNDHNEKWRKAMPKSELRGVTEKWNEPVAKFKTNTIFRLNWFDTCKFLAWLKLELDLRIGLACVLKNNLLEFLNMPLFDFY